MGSAIVFLFFRSFVAILFGHLKPPDCNLLLIPSIKPQILRKKCVNILFLSPLYVGDLLFIMIIVPTIIISPTTIGPK